MDDAERLAELWELPDHVTAAYDNALALEVQYRIQSEFACDVKSLSVDEYLALLLAINNLIHKWHLTPGRAACRAFARFVMRHGGAEKFGVSEAAVAEWSGN